MRSSRLFAAGALVLSSLTVTCAEQPVQPSERIAGQPAELRRPNTGDAGPEQRYIVVFKSDVSDPAGLSRTLASDHKREPRHVFTLPIKGFSAPLSAASVEALRRNPRVAYVEAVQTFAGAGHRVQTGAPWGLDRIDQDALPLNGTYKFTRFELPLYVHLLDSGQNNYVAGDLAADYRPEDGMNGQDCNGHGTAVAAVLKHQTFGVARPIPPQMALRYYRILGCNGLGTTDDLIAAIQSVIAFNVGNNGQVMIIAGTVLNSQGVEVTSTSVDNAVAGAYNDGVTVVVAAGDQNKNACNVSPARVGVAITVAGSTSTDARTSSSNVGSCVDIFAPGSGIRSIGLDVEANFTGTSFATAHAAGLAHLRSSTGRTPAQVWSIMQGLSNPNRLTNIGSGSPNRLLHTEGVLTVGVSGPSSVSTASPHTWTASVTGGVGHYTYRWTVRRASGQVIPVAGTSSSVSITPAGNWGIFYVNAWVRSDGSPEANGFRAVNNQIPGGCTLC